MPSRQGGEYGLQMRHECARLEVVGRQEWCLHHSSTVFGVFFCTSFWTLELHGLIPDLLFDSSSIHQRFWTGFVFQGRYIVLDIDHLADVLFLFGVARVR